MHIVRVVRVGCAFLLAVTLGSGLPRPAGAETAATVSPAAAKEAAEIFATRCALCHGAGGKGDGAAAAALNPKPQAFDNPAWQASVTDDQLEKAIVGGGVAVGKSTMMPANPDLEAKPDVVRALRASVRGFGSKQ